jgi:hypothetical protein
MHWQKEGRRRSAARKGEDEEMDIARSFHVVDNSKALLSAISSDTIMGKISYHVLFLVCFVREIC